MPRIFNSIRKSGIASKNMKHYFIYAIGEIILVMIGILLAMQVNNWNEKRKNSQLEMEIYQHFLTVLTKDSVDLALIDSIFNGGYQAQKYFIENKSEDIIKEKSQVELEALILRTLDVSHSFFPRYGIYQEVLNNGEFALLKSDEIKNQLTEIYERRYRLYEHVDATVEQKIHFNLQPIVKGRYQLFLKEENIEAPHYFDEIIFSKEYVNFTLELRNMNSILGSTKKIIGVMADNISKTLEMLRKELEQEN